MGQVSAYLRQGTGSFLHWCPACEEVHQLPFPNRGWTFDGNLERPTFTPSFKHWWTSHVTGAPVPQVCHYTLTAGVMFFHEDNTHAMRGHVPLPVLPPQLQDPCDWSDG